jgi:hypothetical protein
MSSHLAIRRRYSPLDRCCQLRLVSDIAMEANRLMGSGDELFCCRANRILVNVC